MSRSHALLLALLLCAAWDCDAETRWPLWGNLKPGPYRVGFRDIASWDEARAWTDETLPSPVVYPRPVRVMLWYPAAANAPQTGTFRQYLTPHWGQPFEDAVGRNLVAHDMGRYYLGGGVAGYFLNDANRIESLLASPTAASLNVSPAAERFPLVVYSLGQNDTAVENIPLWEYLASHGYVVLTVPHLGTNPRRFYLLIHDVDSYEAQVRDLEFALNVVAHEPFIDHEAIAAAGHSMGGEYALLAAMRNPRIRAVVGLDPSYMSKGAPFKLKIVEEPSFSASSLRVPLLVQHRRNDEEATRDVIDRLHFADVTEITYDNLVHGDFNASCEYTARNPPNLLNREELTVRDAATAARGFEEVCQTTLAFLDSVFRGTRFDPDAYRAPGVAMISNRHHGLDTPDEERFFGLVATKGVDDAMRALAEAQFAHPGEVIIDEDRLRAVASQLGYVVRNAQALEMFRFYARAFPLSPRAHAALASRLEQNKDVEGALREYRRVIELKPGDENAIQHIATLMSQTVR